MNSIQPEPIRKVPVDAVEVIEAIEVIGADQTTRNPHAEDPVSAFRGFSGVKVMKGGPVMLFFGFVLLPVILIALFVFGIFALFFGKSVIKKSIYKVGR